MVTTDGNTRTETGMHWKEQDECQDCGVDRSDAALRAIKLKDGGRDLLCNDCFSQAVEEGRVEPSDPRVT